MFSGRFRGHDGVALEREFTVLSSGLATLHGHRQTCGKVECLHRRLDRQPAHRDLIGLLSQTNASDATKPTSVRTAPSAAAPRPMLGPREPVSLPARQGILISAECRVRAERSKDRANRKECPGTRVNDVARHHIGRGGGIRTHGLFVPNEARYQAAPHPGCNPMSIPERPGAPGPARARARILASCSTWVLLWRDGGRAARGRATGRPRAVRGGGPASAATPRAGSPGGRPSRGWCPARRRRGTTCGRPTCAASGRGARRCRSW